jgi:hypothetical protein
MQEQIGPSKREMEILRKIIKILESKTSEREIKHAFDGLIR